MAVLPSATTWKDDDTPQGPEQLENGNVGYTEKQSSEYVIIAYGKNRYAHVMMFESQRGSAETANKDEKRCEVSAMKSSDRCIIIGAQ